MEKPPPPPYNGKKSFVNTYIRVCQFLSNLIIFWGKKRNARHWLHLLLSDIASFAVITGKSCYLALELGNSWNIFSF